MKKRIFFLIIGIILFSQNLCFAAYRIAISEIQTRGAASDDDFVELYNPTSSYINLQTLPLKLHYVGSTGSNTHKVLTFANTTIPPFGYFLITTGAAYTGSVTADATFVPGFAANGGVYISNSATANTNVIDMVGWGNQSLYWCYEGTAFSPGTSYAPPVNGSIERKPGASSQYAGNGTDTDNNSVDFSSRAVSDPQNSSSTPEPAPPEQIQDLSASSGNNEGEIILDWTAPGDDGTIGNAVRYDIKYSFADITDDGEFNSATSVSIYSTVPVPSVSGTTQSMTITGLDNAVNYFFAIKTQDDDPQWSLLSISANATAKADTTAPAAITALSALKGNIENTIKLTWISPGDNGTLGNLIMGSNWIIAYSTYSNYQWQQPPVSNDYELGIPTECAPLSSHTKVIDNLFPGATYYFRIWTADESDNYSPVSTGATAYAQLDVTPPPEVLNFSASSDGTGNNLDLTWTNPGYDFAGVIVKSTTSAAPLTSHTQGNLVHQGTGEVDTDENFSITGLTDNVIYYFYIWSYDLTPNYSTTTVTANASSYDDVPPESITDFSVTPSSAGNKLNLSWTNPADSDFTGILIKCSSDSTAGYPQDITEGYAVYNSTGGPQVFTATSIINLIDGVTYYFSIWAYDEVPNYSYEFFEAGACPNDYTPPSPVTGLSIAQDFTGNKLKLTWTNPSDSDFTGIIIRSSGGTGATYPPAITSDFSVYNSSGLGPGATMELTLTGLTDHLTYYFSFWSYDEVPNYSTQKTTAQAYPSDTTPPSPITDFIVLVVNTGNQLSLSWTNPAEADFTGIIIRSSAGIGAAYPAALTDGFSIYDSTGLTPGATAGISLTGLTDNLTYYFSIWTADEAPNYSTQKATAQAFPIDTTPPSPIMDFTVLVINIGNQLNLSWTNPAEADFTGIIIRSSAGIGAAYPAALIDGFSVYASTGLTPGATAGISLTGLSNDLTYYFSIWAGDEAPNYSAQVSSSAFPHDSYISAPDNFTVTVDSAGNILDLKWVNPADSDFAGVIIRSSGTGFPAGVTEGYLVYRGTGILQPALSTASLVNLTDDSTYYFSLWAFDELNYSQKITGLNYPHDYLPPAAVTDLAALPVISGNSITLTWTNPADSDFTGIIIRSSAGMAATYPSTITAGFSVYNSSALLENATKELTLTGLTDNLTYYFSIWSGDEAENYSLVYSTAFCYPRDELPPLPVTLLNITQVLTGNTLNLSWANPEDADMSGITVRYSTQTYPPGLSGGSLLFSMGSVSGAVISTAAAGLTDNVTYYFSLWTADEVPNYSVLFTTAQGYPADKTAPAVPLNLEVTNPGNSGDTLNISWDWDINSSSADLAGFRLYRSTSSGLESFINIALLQRTTHQDTGLTEYSTYWYYVTAIDEAPNESFASNVSSGRPVFNTLPGDFSLIFPTGAVVLASLNTTFYWQAAIDTDPGDTVLYKFRYSTYSAFFIYSEISGIATNYFNTGLLHDNTNYFWEVTAYDTKAGIKRNTAGRATFYMNLFNDYPSDFTLLTPTGQITGLRPGFDWTDSYDPDPFDYIRYDLYLSSAPGVSFPKPVWNTIASSTAISFDLRDNTTYFWYTIGRDSSGYATSSSTGVFCVNQSNEAPLSFLLLAPSSGQSPVRSSTPAFSWEEARDLDPWDRVNYKLVYSSSPDFSLPAETGWLSSLSTSPATAMADHTTFYWKVIARDLSGAEKVSSSTFYFYLNYNNRKPAGFDIIRPTGTIAGTWPLFEWQETTDPDSFDPVSYSLHYSSLPGAIPGKIWNITLTTAAPAAQLFEDTTYYWFVRANDALTWTQSASTGSFYILDLSTPLPPANLALTQDFNSSGTLKLSWTALSPDVLEYYIYRGTESGASFTNVTATVSAGPFTDGDLQNYSSYYYKIKARDYYLHISSYSDLVYGYPRDKLPPAAITDLGLAASAAGNTLILYWTNPADSDFTGAIIRSSAGPGAAYPEAISSGFSAYNTTGLLPCATRELTLTGLTDNLTYYFSIWTADGVLNYSILKTTGALFPSDKTPPGGITAFSAVAVNEGNKLKLAWTNPRDSDFTGILIRSSVGAGAAYPETISSGYSAYFSTGLVPDAAMELTLTGLTDNLTYYFSIWTADEALNYSTAQAAAGAFPQDTLPPAGITDLTVTREITGKILFLSWTNPQDTDFAGILIRHKTTGFPLTATDGFLTYRNAGLQRGTTQMLTVTGLTDDLTCYFSLWSFDEAPNYSLSRATASAFPQDTVPPSGLTDLTLTRVLAGNALSLSWTNPQDTDFTGILLKVKTGGFPADISDGALVYNTTGLTPGFVSELLVPGLTDHLTYYFSAWSYDKAKNYSLIKSTAFSFPSDSIPPAAPAAFSIAQDAAGNKLILTWTNPADSDFTGLHIRCSSTTGSPPQARTEGYEIYTATGLIPARTLSLEAPGLANYLTYYFSIWSFDYAPNYSVTKTTACAYPRDLTPPAVALPEISVDGKNDLTFTPNQDGIRDRIEIEITITENIETIARVDFIIKDKNGNTVYTAPPVLQPSSGKIQFEWDGKHTLGPDKDRIIDGEYEYLLDIYDTAGNKTPKSGKIRVYNSSAQVRQFTNFPNPFRAGAEETNLRYKLEQGGRVVVNVYNLLGEHIWRWEGEGRAGFNDCFWNGRNESGVVLADGVYICHITGPALNEKRKIAVRK